MGNWFEKRLEKEMKDPEFKALWEKDEPADKIIQYMIENDIEFTQEFVDSLYELAERGAIFETPECEKTKKTKKIKRELEFA